jgi:hypothetical protein
VFGLTTDWRWTLWLNVPVGMIVFAIIFFFMPTIKHEKKPSIDICGSVILAIILSSIVLAADANDKIFGSLMDASGMSLATIRWILIIFAAIMLGVFIWVEKRVKEQIDQKVREGVVKPKEGVEFQNFYEKVLRGYTYMSTDRLTPKDEMTALTNHKEVQHVSPTH